MPILSTDFSKKTIDSLAKRSSYICSNLDCRKNTTIAHSTFDKAITLGEAAHIKGQTNRSARFDKNLTEEQIRHIDNGIWLCRDCHKKIDSDENKYPTELLYEWKKKAEANNGDYRQIIQETTDQAVKKTLIGLGINISLIVPKPEKDVLKDINIKSSFEEWAKGNTSKAQQYAENAYYSSSGIVKLQSIVNIILLGKDDLARYDYMISLCNEGIEIAEKTKSISTGGILKSNKARLLNHRIFENSIRVYGETQMRELTGFPSMDNSQITILARTIKSDGDMVQQLAIEAQKDAIKANDHLAMANIKMTLASTMGQMYLLTKQLGGNYGEIEHYVIKTYLEAKDIFEKLKDKEGVAYVLHNLANNMRFFGNKKKALEFSTEAGKIAVTIGNKALQNKIVELKQRLVDTTEKEK